MKEKNVNESLKRMAKLIEWLGYGVVVIGLSLVISLILEGDFSNGVICFMASSILALLLITYSKLIFIFIEIAENTRRQNESNKQNLE